MEISEQSPLAIDASSAFRELEEKLTSLETPEEKIAQGLAFMRSSISQEGTPHFREFWEVRRSILPLFREHLHPIVRSKLWEEYVELTVEARRLKEILEEQSAFAMEQIDLAIQALERDLANFEVLLGQMENFSLPERSLTLEQKAANYNQLQRELNLWNTLSSRLVGLRKEILATDMRVRFKTKLFKRLSEIGDQIFPKRKELVERVSFEFEGDVERFVHTYFREGQVVGAPYYVLKEEIKALQDMAKVFTLNSASFSRTRLKLSACWDQIRTLEKERRKAIEERRQASSEQRQALENKIEELKKQTKPLSELDREIQVLLTEMRAIPLEREDVRAFRRALDELRAPHIAQEEEKRRKREEEEKEKLRLRREKIEAVKEQIAALLKEGKQIDFELLTARMESLQKEIDQLELLKGDRQQIERQLRPLRDLMASRKEELLLNLSDDQKKMLENLRAVLEQRKERRKEIKEQMETHRKALGVSGLDFEKAMLYRELIDQEKERLEAMDEAIEEMQQKVVQLQWEE